VTPRSIPSHPPRSTWPSAAPARCSSPTRSPRSATSRALRGGGRLALVSWRTAGENEWITSLFGALTPDAPPPTPPADAPTPFRHADPADTTRILTDAGFHEVALEALDVPMYFGRDADEGFPILKDLLGWTVRDLEPSDAEKAMTRLRDLLLQHQSPDGVAFGCAAWLITARRAHTT
jgi:hypothetical protein